MQIKSIAFFLPQFHPIPENDEWWGKGFTEWRNVAAAPSLFDGHYQPHHPADLGYYDLRLEEVRSQQAELAREYEIYGFCYYHYWFSGKQLIDRPVREILNSHKPDFPFCLCWANENWTRRWDGLDQEVLISQNYSLADDEEHFFELLPYFKDPRYIRINEKPLFIVYRSSLLPDSRQTTQLWRRLAMENGLQDLYLVRVESFPTERNRDPKWDGFDASLDFQPDWSHLPRLKRPNLFWRALKKLGIYGNHVLFKNHVFDYKDVVSSMLSRTEVDYPRFPSVTPAWDNTARRRNGGATIFHGSSPEKYGEWLSSVLTNNDIMSKLPEPIIFINAWNEWAEGNHLEPDLKWGRAYLEETKRVLQEFKAGLQ